MKNILFLILSLCACTELVYSDIIWSTPVSISSASVNAADPDVVIDSNGNITAAWVENNVIMAASLPFGGSWNTPVALSNLANTSSKPKIKVDATGNVTAIWMENNILESATLPFGGSWSAETAISGSGVTNFAFDVDASGNAVAVWVRSNNIEASTRKLGIWSLVSVLSILTSSNPDIKISSNGQAIAVWQSLSSGSDILVSDNLTISTNIWAATKNITTPTTALRFNYPKVAIDSNGNATVAAFRYNFNSASGAYSNVQVLSFSLSSGATSWTQLPSFLSNSGIGNPANLKIRLKADVNGDVLAVWTNLYDGMTYTIESSNKLNGGSWPVFVTLQNPTVYSFGADIAISQGSALLVNMLWDDVSNINIVSQESDTTNPILQGWTNINQVSTGNFNAYPKCALNVTSSQSNAVAVWMNFNGTNTTINASIGSDSVIAPPSNVLATQTSTNFGIYTDYYNTITWNPSPDPNIIQYNIYRNGVFFASTPPDTLTFVDHNQAQSGTSSVTYGVSVLDGNFRQSAMINYTLN